MSPIQWAALGSVFAAWLFHQQSVLHPLGAWMAGALAVPCLLICVVCRSPSGWAVGMAAACSVWAITQTQALDRLSERMPLACETAPQNLRVEITDLPFEHDKGWRFLGRILNRDQACGRLPPTLVFQWYVRPYEAPLTLYTGQVWQLTAAVKRPVAGLNFQGLDIQAHWFAQHIGGTATVKNGVRDVAAQTSADTVQSLRGAWGDRIDRVLGARANAPVIKALVIGEQRGIKAAQWSVFSATGIGHLVSISGLHITLFASLAGGLCGLLWKRSVRLCAWLPAPMAMAATGWLAALAYAAVAGWGIPAQRTVYMLLAVLLALWLKGPLRPLDVLAFAALMVIASDPWAVMNAGFILSFGAVLLLMLSGAGRYSLKPQRFKTVRLAARAQWVITVGLLPLGALLFASMSWVAPVANAFAIPWVSYVVTPLAMLGTFLPLDWALVWACSAFDALCLPLATLATIEGAVTPLATPPVALYLLCQMAALYALGPPALPARALAWVVLSSLWWWPCLKLQAPAKGQFYLETLDIGQGNSVAIQTRNHTLIYDAGPASSPEADSGARVVVPWLMQHGIAHPDMLVVSHRDNDHFGGVPTVMKKAPPMQWISTLEMNDPLFMALPPGIDHTPCRSGLQWIWDGVRFEVLHPDEAFTQRPREPNDLSCTLKITDAEGRSALLAGDIGVSQEARIIERMGADRLKSDILLVPHHGSDTSSSAGWIKAVAPKIALFQFGHRNRYGHPVSSVVQRYTEAQVQTVFSDEQGAVRLTPDPNNPQMHWQMQSAKAQRMRYWHTPP